MMFPWWLFELPLSLLLCVEDPGEGGGCLVISVGRGDVTKSRAQTRQVASCTRIHTEALSATRSV